MIDIVLTFRERTLKVLNGLGLCIMSPQCWLAISGVIIVWCCVVGLLGLVVGRGGSSMISSTGGGFAASGVGGSG